MIIDELESYWIYIVATEEKKFPKNWAKCGGKWLIFEEYKKLKSLAHKIDSYVESHQIETAKFSREPLFYDTPVMCVYCLDSDKEKVWLILKELGIQKRIWKYDKQTLRDWEPDGKLYQRFRNQ